MQIIGKVLVLLLQIAACVAVADLLSGLFHWLEDSYGNPDWPVTGKWITEVNDLHHREPRAFLSKNWLQSADVQLIVAAIVIGVASLCGWLCWQLALVAGLLVNANEFHKWAHRTPAENNAVISWFQRTGLIQSPRHHGKHHQGAKDRHYCIVTSYLNPTLDCIGFWRGMERLVLRVFGVGKRPMTADFSLKSSPDSSDSLRSIGDTN